MQTKLSKLLLLLVAFTLFYCSEEQIVPNALEEDLETHMQAYGSNEFVVELTTVQSEPDATQPTLVDMYLDGASGKISVNWGDGSIEKLTLQPGLQLSHQYARFKNYAVKITGDIKNIEGYKIAYQEAIFRNIHFSGLTGLKYLRLVLIGHSPAVINLTHNKMVESVMLMGCRTTQDLILPTVNKITQISIAGQNMLSTAVVDRVISRIYDSVVANPRVGGFGLGASWYQEESSDDMVGPPSGYSLSKLRKLRDNFGWSLSPDFDHN